MKELTIGITTYNNHPFIQELLYSITEQIEINTNLLDKIDFVLIDDNSNEDEMKGFINESIPKYIKKIINTENHNGPSYSRNKIIKEATSKYILFFDGDDSLQGSLLNIITELENTDADLIVSNVLKVFGDGKIGESPFMYSGKLFSGSCKENLVKLSVHQTGIWSIYKTSFIKTNNIFYEENMRYEDNLFMSQIYLSQPKVSTLRERYYGWRVNYSSFTNRGSNVLEHRLRVYSKILDLLREDTENENAPWILYSIWNQTYINIIRGYPGDITEKERYSFYQKLNKITKKHKPTLHILMKKLDSKNIDKYTNMYKKVHFNNYALIYIIKQGAKLRRNITKIKHKVLQGFQLLPIQKNKIFITSHYGEFNDNSKYFYLEFKKSEEYKRKKLVFAVKEIPKDLEINPKDFILYNNRILFFYHHYTAKEVYFNTWYNPLIKKRHQQLWHQLWHGIPYKKIHKDINTYNMVFSKEHRDSREESILKWDKLYSVNQYNTNIFKSLFPTVEIVEEIPFKTRWLISNASNVEVKEIAFEKYKLEREKNYILYAPTYRPYKVYLDFAAVKSKVHPEEVLLIHMHPMMNFEWVNPPENEVKYIKSDDIQEIILLTSGVITDYSSIAYDYIESGKTVVFYKPDLKLYNAIHGLYEPID